MAGALVAHTGKDSTDGSSVTTSGINTTGANLIVVARHAFSFNPAISAVTDNKSNTYTKLTNWVDVGSGYSVQLSYCLNPTVGSGHTFSVNQGGTFPTLTVQAFSGAKLTSVTDQENGSGTNTPGSITPSEDNEILVAACCYHDGSTQTVDAAFTRTDAFGNVTGVGGGMGYEIQTTATARNPAWSASNGPASVVASFKSEPTGTTYNEAISLGATTGLALAAAATADVALSLSSTPAVATPPHGAAEGALTLTSTPAVAFAGGLVANEAISLDASPELDLANVITALDSISLAGTPGAGIGGGFTVTNPITLTSSPSISVDAAVVPRPRVFRPGSASGPASPFRPSTTEGTPSPFRDAEFDGGPGIFRPGS